MDLILAKRISERLKVEELPPVVHDLLRSAKDGHLCHPIESVDPILLQSPFVVDGNRLYLQRNWDLETAILEKIRLLWNDSAEPIIAVPEELQPSQAQAIINGSKRRFAIFTGGPGTGKTYTAGWFIRLLKARKVIVTAPTGKAASHLESAVKHCEVESYTLHRLLKLQPGMQRLYSNRTIDADLVVVDEASMIDPLLLLHLLNAIGPTTRLLLLGDPDQLPPVEGGSLFPELADLFGQKLNRSMRMGDGPLYSLSQAILRGEAIPIEPMGDLSTPIYHDPIQHLEEQKHFRILCALRQGPFGADALNQSILSTYKGASIPILIIQNDPKQQLYNGTTGVLCRKIGYFSSPDGIRQIPESKLPRFEPAFCLSVHKSQGSEYDEVLAIFPPGSERFGKEALYTAITRAKKSVKLWMDLTTLEAALKTTARKRSGFTQRFLKMS